MKELQELSKSLLADGQVNVVIGWEDGPTGARPAFITKPEDADRLIFDTRCVHNLAAYLSPRRPNVAKLDKAAIVVKPCDAKAVAGLLQESQIKREDVVIIGMRCGGVLADPASKAALSAETVSERCPGCESREPTLADHVLGEMPAPPPGERTRDKRIDELEALSPVERWAFWQAEFERCVRCNACRQVCPLCTCDRCVTEKTQPLWIEPSAHASGSFAWHITRAQHHAGRCADCGECARVCPVDIPLGLLNREVARIVERRFGFEMTDDPATPEPVGAFRMEDEQEFIR